MACGGFVGSCQAGCYMTPDDLAAANLHRALDENTSATQRHTQALKDVKLEIERQTAFSKAMNQTDSLELKRYLAELLSGHVGAAAVRRPFTPNAGKVCSYGPDDEVVVPPPSRWKRFKHWLRR